ncbi:MAG: glycosyltransferase [Bacteroidales bacterium]|nr:glycosyltransferase [Bacteroidales bacterium]
MTDLAVIMSVYQNDKLKFLKESVQSILNQTFSQFHYYIAFDGPVSQDIDAYISSLNDYRIRLFRLEKNGGLANALNYLLKVVLKNPEYKLIARMDADDISSPERFEKQRNSLLNNTDISCVGCWYQEIDVSGKHLSDRKLPVKHEALRKLYYTRTPFAHPSVMYRRNLIETAGLYPTDTILMEDNVLWGRALKKGFKFANIPEYLLKFRKDESFYKRRSGINYGWNFIITRFKINRSLSFPKYSYLLLFMVGIIKMMPSFVLRYIYVVARKL